MQRRVSSIILFLVASLTIQLHAAAQPVPLSLRHCATVKVEEAIDGETLLSQEGETIKLAGVKAPELWGDDAPYASWPFATQSRDILAQHAEGKTLEFFCEGDTLTHDGALIGHALLPTGNWLQYRLVAEGAVMVYPRANHIGGLAGLYAAENIARLSEKGLWPVLENTITQATDIVRPGWFQIVQGTILSAKRGRNVIYLNFGDDWGRDFTVEIPRIAERHFRAAQVDPLSLEGREVEVRGWVDMRGGPRIVAEGPGQIRIITENSR